MDGKIVVISHSVLLHVMGLYHPSIITTHENLDNEISNPKFLKHGIELFTSCLLRHMFVN